MGSAYQVFNYIESNFLWNNLKQSRVNLAFPILYVLATIVICGLPMIITPVETAIGLAMILSGNSYSCMSVTKEQFWKRHIVT